MIFHDRVSVRYTTEGPPDPFGNPTTEKVTITDVPAEVFSLDSDLAMSGDRAAVINRYRVVIHRMANIPAMNEPSSLRIGWGSYPFIPGFSNSGLVADGAVEQHVIRGRLSHYEIICRSVVG